MSCARCHGTGEVCVDVGMSWEDQPCPDCGGSGDSPVDQIEALRQAVNDLAERVERLEERSGSNEDEEL